MRYHAPCHASPHQSPPVFRKRHADTQTDDTRTGKITISPGQKSVSVLVSKRQHSPDGTRRIQDSRSFYPANRHALTGIFARVMSGSGTSRRNIKHANPSALQQVAPAHHQFLRHRSSLFPSSHTSHLQSSQVQVQVTTKHTHALRPPCLVCLDILSLFPGVPVHSRSHSHSFLLSSSSSFFTIVCFFDSCCSRSRIRSRGTALHPSTFASSLARYLFFPSLPD
ncbi:hypothetical protein HDV62DRAFT_331272 [Trichoderma sp. SZMC 28011]